MTDDDRYLRLLNAAIELIEFVIYNNPGYATIKDLENLGIARDLIDGAIDLANATFERENV